MAELIYTDPDGKRIAVQVTPTQGITVGRNPTSGITTSNPSVSRNHADFRYHGPHLVLRDLGSSNGTFVRIKGRHALQQGHFFLAGRQLFRFERVA